MSIKKLGNSGFTLVEGIVAAGIMALGAYVVMYGVSKLQMGLTNVKEVAGRELEVNNVIENLRSNINLFQVNYNFTESQVSQMSETDLALDVRKLPLAYNELGIFEASACPDCTGKLGYVVQPVSGRQGLYQVTVRIMDRRAKSLEDYQDYVFVVAQK